MILNPFSAPLPYDAGVHIPTTAANRHTGKMEGLPHYWPEGRAGVHRGLEEGGTTFEKSLSGVYQKPKKGQICGNPEGQQGNTATLTGSMLFSITKDAKIQPEVHLGDNKGTSKVHPGDTNHTDTLITPSTMSTKHTHNRATVTEDNAETGVFVRGPSTVSGLGSLSEISLVTSIPAE